MIDIKLIRENAEYIQQNCARRGYDVDIAALLKIETKARQINQEIEELRAERNRLSKQCAADPAAREKVKTLKGLVPVLAVAGSICVLVILEPSMSVTMCLAFTTLFMLIAGGISKKHTIMFSIPAVFITVSTSSLAIT